MSDIGKENTFCFCLKRDIVRAAFYRILGRSPTGDVHVTRSKLETKRLGSMQAFYTGRRGGKMIGTM